MVKEKGLSEDIADKIYEYVQYKGKQSLSTNTCAMPFF